MNYSVNIDIDGYTRVNITDETLDTAKDSTIIVVIDSSSDSKLYEYYTTLKNIIINGNRLVLLLDGNKSKIRKQLCMLMVSYNKYDIYRLEDISIVNANYIADILARNPGKEEVETFIDSDVVLGGEINNLLSKFTELVRDQNFSELNELMINNINLLENTINVVDYLKNVADASNTGFVTTVEKLKKDVADKEATLHNAEKELNDKMFSINKLNKDILNYKDEIAKYKKLVDSAAAPGGANIVRYSAVNTGTETTRVGAILYFKELGKLRYINTFIISLLNILQKISKVNTKLLIYDSNTNFNIYKPLPVVTAMSYNNNKDTYIKTSDRMVIVEPITYMLSDMLQSDAQVLIIYDRLRENEDLVIGPTVYKYYVVSSSTEFEALKHAVSNVPIDHVIGHPGIASGIIGIPDLNREQLKKTTSTVTNAYFKLTNPCGNGEEIIPSILREINATSLRRR